MRAAVSMLMLACLAGCGGTDQPAPAMADGAVTTVASAEPSAGTEPAESAPITGIAPKRPVIEETIAYGEANDRNLTGFLTLPADSFEPPPGVLVIHERWGLNDDVRDHARRLAGEGFVVLAIDLYADEVAESPAQAQELMTQVMTAPDAALENIRQGVEYLRRYAMAPRVATYGWSFGGTWSLEAGLTLSEHVDAVVTYYGQTVIDQSRLETLGSPLLGMFAGNDETISTDAVVEFRSALRRAGKDAQVRIYPEAQHGFANPSSQAYEPDVAEEAWGRAVEFLALNLN